MTEYAIGNLLWLKNPTAAPELPRKQLLAHAYASMQPSDHLWKKYLAETARLQEHGGISEDDYYLLRHSLAAKSALMDLTLGEESTFTEGTVQEVLIVAKERLRADLIEAVAQEQDRTRLAETRLQNIEERQNNSRTSICSLAAKIAAATCKVLLLICGVLIVFGILLTFPWEFPMPLSNWNQYLFSALLIVLLIISAGNLLIGVTVRSLLEWLERRIAAVLIRSFLSFAGLTKPEENKNNNEHK
jgi:hypothetical protein